MRDNEYNANLFYWQSSVLIYEKLLIFILLPAGRKASLPNLFFFFLLIFLLS